MERRNLPKPQWLRKKRDLAKERELKAMFSSLGLHTVCQEALCPNIRECFSQKVATFMILGNICTRNCRFCGIRKGSPQRVDFSHPAKIKRAVELMGLKYVVITSPSRDDLEDKGAGVFILTIKELRKIKSLERIEVLIPDFSGDRKIIASLLEAKPDVVSHNLETVARLYPLIRPDSSYQRSLGVLRMIKEIAPSIFTKSAIILGLGESREEVLELLSDLRKINCDSLCLGQYLPPSSHHYPVREYLPPQEYNYWAKIAKKMGFKKIKSSPFVRSSYFAHSDFDSFS